MLHKKCVLPFLLLLTLLASAPSTSVFANGNGEIIYPICMYDGGVCATLTYTVDCDGWEWSSLYITSTPPYGLGDTTFYLHNGTWTNPKELESGQITGTVEIVIRATGESLGVYDFIFEIAEPSECLPSSRTLKPKYYMYTLRDGNQPETWSPYCYIISNNGFPSVERQAQLCSVPGFDHTFQATQLVYSGWVSTGCGGPSYGWPAWDPDWYKPEFAID